VLVERIVCSVPVRHASALVAALLFASGARAYSDPTIYAEDPLAGGGGGRYFTGSSADGFGCDVCHAGGEVVDLAISGLPLDGFEPGVGYEITIGWPASAEHVAIVAELTDEARLGAGTLELPRPDATPEPERCSGELLGAPSSDLHAAEGGRQLVSVIDCGARALRFRWTAPVVAPERVWFHVGFITTDEDTTPAGDGVTMARQVLPRAGTALPARVLAQGCSGTYARGEYGAGLALFVAASLLISRALARYGDARKDTR
jgi:hypothetical protein